MKECQNDKDEHRTTTSAMKAKQRNLLLLFLQFNALESNTDLHSLGGYRQVSHVFGNPGRRIEKYGTKWPFGAATKRGRPSIDTSKSR